MLKVRFLVYDLCSWNGHISASLESILWHEKYLDLPKYST